MNTDERRWGRVLPAVLACAVLCGCPDGNTGTPDADDGDAGEDALGDVEPDAPEGGEGDADALDVPPEVPPRVCNEPVTLGRGPYFNQATLDVGFDRDHLYLLGNSMTAADIDGDGYPDLIVHHGTTNTRDDPTNPDPATWGKRVLLNRPGGGGRTFVDWTVESGYGATRDGAGLGRAATSAAFGDIDNDGDLDILSLLWVGTDSTAPPDPGDRTEVLLNDGSGVFTLAPPSAISPGPTEKWSTNSGSLFDYDLDGSLDAYVGNWYRRYGWLEALQDRLYRGAGDGTFTDATDGAGMTTDTTGYEAGTAHKPTFGITVCDIDDDGDGDVLSSTYGRQRNMLWENLGDGTFRDIAAEVGFDADDVLDYTDNQMYACYCQANPTVCTAATPMMDCSGAGWYPGDDDQPWNLAGNTFTTLCGDADNDGDLDLYNAEIRHWWAGISSDPSQLLENVPSPDTRGWTLLRIDNETNGLARNWRAVDWNEGDLRAAFLDFDNDGLKDIYLASSDYPDQRGFLFHRLPDGTYEELRSAGLAHPGPSGLVIADFDRDGDQDVIVGSATMRNCCGWTENEVHYYRNDVGQSGNRIQIRLVGDPAAGTNRSAIGARVTVVAGGVTQVQEVGGGYGHGMMQHDLVLHFGLGAACDVDSVEVRWPNASLTVQRWEDVRANYRAALHQGDEAVWYE